MTFGRAQVHASSPRSQLDFAFDLDGYVQGQFREADRAARMRADA